MNDYENKMDISAITINSFWTYVGAYCCAWTRILDIQQIKQKNG